MIDTTYGRVLFNSILPRGMDFYNMAFKSVDLSGVISDCYQNLGRKATIELLDAMMQLGFREATRSGLSFATDDLVTPSTKIKHLGEADKSVMKYKKLYDRGIIVSQLPFAELKKRSNIMQAGKAADLAPDDSERIRQDRPGF